MTRRTNRYFAYGSNLNQSDWQDWCLRKGHQTDLLQPLFRAVLPDWRLAFSRKSDARKGGVLDVKRSIGQVVPGVVFEVAEGGWEALNEKEGAPKCYQLVETTALNEAGNEVPVTTYEVPEKLKQPFVKPDPDYVEIVRNGLNDFDLDDSMLYAAVRDEKTVGEVNNLFVYGTLLRGEHLHCDLPREEIECILLAEARGELIDLGEYPGLERAESGEVWVRGEFIRVKSPARVLKVLDHLEGFRGFGVDGSLFRRSLIDVGVGEGRVRRSWVYVLNRVPPVKRPIRSGDWREHRGVWLDFVNRLVQLHCGTDEEGVAARLAESEVMFNSDTNGFMMKEHFLPLSKSLLDRTLSERRLAQVTGRWVVVPS